MTKERIALQVEPLHSDYAERGVLDSFDWQQIVPEAYALTEQETPLYLVAFYSQLRSNVTNTQLAELTMHDSQAHEDALRSPALLHYFGGTPNALGRALSFCLWSDRQAAKDISQDPIHVAAKAMVRFYESYRLERFDVYRIQEDVLFVPRSNHRAH